jgi:hypothetical protein
MTRSSRPRQTANLSDSVQQQLTMYALAAGAAGVGVLALTAPAEAKIVYTPAHEKIVNRLTPIDLNHDGKADLYFSFATSVGGTFTGGTGLGAEAYYAPPSNALVAVTTQNQKFNAVALRAGERIGPKRKFAKRFATLAGYFVSGMAQSRRVSWRGQWANGGKGLKNRYAGVRFIINGELRYGWIRISVVTHTKPRAFYATITGYAYETIANKPIIAGQTMGTDEIDNHVDEANPAPLTTLRPQPATLGALAMGAPGLSIWRREEQVSPRQQTPAMSPFQPMTASPLAVRTE